MASLHESSIFSVVTELVAEVLFVLFIAEAVAEWIFCVSVVDNQGVHSIAISVGDWIDCRDTSLDFYHYIGTQLKTIGMATLHLSN